MELKNRSFQYGKYRFRTIASMPHLEAGRGRYSRASPAYTRSTFSKSVMVSVAVSILGTTELMFIELGVKINGAYYRDVLLGQHLLPAIRSVAGDFFIYNASAHRAGDTVEFLFRNTSDFILPLLWSPSSPHLNPVDYEVWGVLQQRVYRSRIRDVDGRPLETASHRGVALVRPEHHWPSGEMSSKLCLIVANLQMHRPTLPPKGSAI